MCWVVRQKGIEVAGEIRFPNKQSGSPPRGFQSQCSKGPERRRAWLEGPKENGLETRSGLKTGKGTPYQ